MITVNGRRYGRPDRVAAICLDGSDPAYFDDVLEHAQVPTLARIKEEGLWTQADSALPSFTNPNNVSIVTGVSPAVHGITGNHFFDGEREVPMESRRFLRCPTILEALAETGSRVKIFTSKKKLARLIGSPNVACSSAEDALPVYSAEASLWVLDRGIEALEAGANLVYLTTTDYVQHKHGPSTDASRRFYQAVDQRLARLDALGVTVALTADHGMNDKPRIVYCDSLPSDDRVVLPITDPYVVHHGALGSMAMVYSKDPVRAASLLSNLGLEILSRAEAADELALPPDRIGDLVLLGDRETVIGTHKKDHDLDQVANLRSHGGRFEQRVPFLCNRPREKTDLRNYDLFHVALPLARPPSNT